MNWKLDPEMGMGEIGENYRRMRDGGAKGGLRGGCALTSEKRGLFLRNAAGSINMRQVRRSRPPTSVLY
ncbi:UNVERIFIED_CONTAM: hypothetical protein Sangu_0608000 [Sesamum angustifolium]|uniref:Uncharacterized protein n=1 Tax=Sesamum angustifolium TaxID=2727405 RepID=A0AAW2QB91_9LAMI